MRRLLIGFLVAAVLAPVAARGGEPDLCCACVPDIAPVATAQLVDPTTAFFCAHITEPAQSLAFETRCGDLPDAGQLCRKTGDPEVDCRALLLEEDSIACPADAGVPALGHPALAGLAALLAGGALVGLRRRRSRPVRS